MEEDLYTNNAADAEIVSMCQMGVWRWAGEKTAEPIRGQGKL